MAMQALGFNFAGHRRLSSPLGLLLLAAGAAAIAVVTLDYLAASEELARVQARHERMVRLDIATRPGKRVAALPATAASGAAGDSANGSNGSNTVMRVTQQLQLPWDALLQDLETLADPSVALLSLDAQGQAHTLRLTGEAKTMAEVLAYVGRLRALPSLDAVQLTSHEEKLAGNVKVIRFTVDATWRKSE
jgi:hypothetical protein